MKLEINLTEDQIDEIVSESIKKSFAVNKRLYGNKIDQEDEKTLRAAMKVVYHFYTGKLLK